MKLDYEDDGHLTVVTLRGELAGDEVEQLGEAARERLEGTICDIVIDLKETEFIDSAGLEMLLQLQEDCSEKLGQLRLVGLTETVENILRLTRLAPCFDYHDDVESAVESLR